MLKTLPDLVVGMHEGAPVYLRDVAEIRRGHDQPEQYVWYGSGPATKETVGPVGPYNRPLRLLSPNSPAPMPYR